MTKAKKVYKKEPEERDFLNEFLKNNKEIMKILGVLVILALVFFGSYYIFKGLGQVKYKNLVFTNEMIGEIPIYRYTYNFNDNNGDIINYNFYVRTNPKKNNVPIEADIEYPKMGNTVYLSINAEGIGQCKESRIAIAGLASFLVSNQFKVESGTSDKWEYTYSNLIENSSTKYLTCETNPKDMVISISQGNESKIYREGNCYRIEINNCEILPAIEKFEIESISQAKENSK
jgi:hypothetical protein